MPTSERPKRPGHYWLRTETGHEQVVEIYDNGRGQGLRVDYDGDPILLADSCWEDCEWEGPLPSMNEMAQLRTDWDGGWPVIKTLYQMRAENCLLLLAIEPFARTAQTLFDKTDDEVYDPWSILDSRTKGDGATIKIPTVGDIRRAAKIYRIAMAVGSPPLSGGDVKIAPGSNAHTSE